MFRYILHKLLLFVPTLIGITICAFAFVRLLPGDPILAMAGEHGVTPERYELLKEQFGYNLPIWQQYLRYVGEVFTGDFGISMRDKASAMQLVIERIPATLQLTIPALFLKVVIGIPAGVYAALHRQSAIDRGVILAAIFGFTIPSFVMGLLLVLIFSITLGLLPSGGQDTWQHGILPTLTMSIGGIGILARFSRSAMIEVMGQPYIRTASAKGMKWQDVVWKHALPNAAVPIVTIVGFMVGTLIAGAVVVESIFSWPGIGRLLVVSVSNRDLAVVQCILLLVAATMVVSNLIVDLLYGFLDPRLRAQSAH